MYGEYVRCILWSTLKQSGANKFGTEDLFLRQFIEWYCFTEEVSPYNYMSSWRLTLTEVSAILNLEHM